MQQTIVGQSSGKRMACGRWECEREGYIINTQKHMSAFNDQPKINTVMTFTIGINCIHEYLFRNRELKKHDYPYNIALRNNKSNLYCQNGNEKKIPKLRIMYKLYLESLRVLKRIRFPNGFKSPEIICFSLRLLKYCPEC